MDQQYIQKAHTLVQALPYIKEFFGKTVVVKYGGSAMVEETLRKNVIDDLLLMHLVGIKPVVVHGGGKHISEMAAKLGIESSFVNGLRVTDRETMRVTQMVLAGLINKDIVSEIELAGGKSCGISGKDGWLIKAEKKVGEGGEDYGLVGEIKSIQPELITILLDTNYIPIVSPVAVDSAGESLNINADVAASKIAQTLTAEKLVFLTDVDGIMIDEGGEKKLISHLDVQTAKRYINDGVIHGGMIPKVESCLAAIEAGVSKVHIINGTVPHALILELFTAQGVGTEIVAE